MLEVLGFYQERLVTESFLRTAVDRASVLELARLIGYQLAPGLAASTWLAFTVQEAPGLPGQPPVVAAVPVGARVQSVPGPDEDPQTFETIEAVEARAAWNAMPVQTAIPWRPERDDTDLFLAGVSTGLAPGDALLIVGQERIGDPGSERWDVRIVAAVEADLAEGRTRVTWLDGLGSHMPSMLPSQDSPRVYALRQRASLFGHNAPDPRLMQPRGSDLGELTEGEGVDRKWKNYTVSTSHIDLDAAYPKVVAAGWVALVSNQGSAGSGSLPGYTELYRVKSVSVVARTDFGMSARLTRVKPDGTEHLDPTVFSLRDTLVLAQSEELPSTSRPLTYPLFGASVTLGSLQPGLTPGRALALSGKRPRVVVADGVKGLAISLPGGGSVPLAAGDSIQLVDPPLRRAGSSVFPMTPEELGAAWGHSVALRLSVRDRDGATGTLDVLARQLRRQSPFEKDETVSEIVFVGDGAGAVEHGRDGTRLQLETAMRYVYDRPGVRVNANVAPATHGETVLETLGSGAANVPDQRFVLRQSPVTQVSAPTASGRSTSLELRVNDLLWKEVRSLYGSGPADRVFTTAIDDAGHTAVRFGDGVEGARPPSGQDNIRARYRKGLGAGGNVAAGQLGNLLTRPLGVNGVTNPEPASGGQDAEDTNDARENAPLTVRTLDRAVSVQDYEDYARGFAGIAKAHAAWIPVGPGRGVLVTVAGDDGAALTSSSAAFSDLLTSLRRFGDALLPLRLATYRPAAFRLRVAVKVAPDREIDAVLGAVDTALRTAFSFALRRFGQPVSVDEIAGVVHAVEGVQAINVLELFRPDQGATPRVEPRLFARLPETFLDALPQAAELLILEPAPLRI
ncbi:MAG TPA: putative baseplate assembly protein, partial [Vicinamibacterales bacterium]